MTTSPQAAPATLNCSVSGRKREQPINLQIILQQLSSNISSYDQDHKTNFIKGLTSERHIERENTVASSGSFSFHGVHDLFTCDDLMFVVRVNEKVLIEKLINKY